MDMLFAQGVNLIKVQLWGLCVYSAANGLAGDAGTTAAMPAVPAQVFAEMLKEMPDNTLGILCQTHDLANPVDIVALACFKALDQSPFQSRPVARARLDAVTLA